VYPKKIALGTFRDVVNNTVPILFFTSNVQLLTDVATKILSVSVDGNSIRMQKISRIDLLKPVEIMLVV
jgi:hypothetical protein